MLEYLKSKLGQVFSTAYEHSTEEKIECFIDQLPDDLLEMIFFRLKGDDLCKSVNRVCKRWQNILASDSFWTKKCIRDGKIIKQLPSILNKKQISWSPKQIYFNHTTFTKNFIENPNGEDSFNHWSFDCGNILCERDLTTRKLQRFIESYRINRIVGLNLRSWNNEWSNQLNYWSLENNQLGAAEKLRDTDGKLLTCFVTSFELGEKMQVIDFQDEDSIYKDILLRLDPIIEIRESYTSRETIKCYYNLRVLLISNELEVIDSFSYSDYIETFPCPWKTVKHWFKVNSQKPPRYILFYHSGQVFEFN
jgi:hypothetical protein